MKNQIGCFLVLKKWKNQLTDMRLVWHLFLSDLIFELFD